jgi:hypothetical protein
MTSKQEIKQVITQSAEPIAMDGANKRIVRILDSNYHKADLNEDMSKATQLTSQQQSRSC